MLEKARLGQVALVPQDQPSSIADIDSKKVSYCKRKCLHVVGLEAPMKKEKSWKNRWGLIKWLL